MRSVTRSRLLLGMVPVALFAGAAPAVCQQAEAAASKPTSQAVAKPTQVAVLGASVSAGFVDIMGKGGKDRNNAFKLKQALRAMWPAKQAKIRDVSDMMMFLDPRKRGQRQLQRILKRGQPDLVLAIDFVFWYGYGRVRVGGKVDEATARLALQRRGFAQLEQLTGQILVGDYPDMRDADPRMLPRAAVPSPAVLKQLNANLRAWVKTRKNVQLFELSKFVAEVKVEDFKFNIGERKFTLTPKQLLQSDRLHATRLGTAVLLHRLRASLIATLGAKHVLAKTDLSMANVIRRLKLEDALPEK